jgi:NADH:ubiquinone oxidoreductase subunit E
MRAQEAVEEPARDEVTVHTVGVCIGTNCYIKGSWKLLQGLASELKQRGLSDHFRVNARFCTGQCEGGPNVVIGNKIISVDNMDTAASFIDAHLIPLLDQKQEITGK